MPARARDAGRRASGSRATSSRARAVRVPVKRLAGAEDIPLPRYMTAGASGADMHAAVPRRLVLKPGEIKLIPTGLAVAVPPGYEGQIRGRSGLALKHGILVVNSPGTVDSDYRGEVGVVLANLSRKPFVIERGDRIAQLVVARVAKAAWAEAPALAATRREAGGFGHTGGGAQTRRGPRKHARPAR
jgi:dUTP pyrophosphatase